MAGLLTCAVIIAVAVQVQFYLWHLRNTGWGNREVATRRGPTLLHELCPSGTLFDLVVVQPDTASTKGYALAYPAT